MAAAKRDSVFGSVLEKGYRIKVSIVSRKARRYFRIRVSRTDGGSWSQVHVLDLRHDPANGVDTDDLLALEEKTEEILQRLPEVGSVH